MARSRSSRAVRWVSLALLISATVVTAGFVLAEPQKKAATGKQQNAAPANPAGKATATKPGTEPAANPGNEAIVARVNKDEIAYKELAEECIARRGAEVLETMIAKLIVSQACRDSAIKITGKEIDDEIGSTAGRLQMTREQYLRVLESERGISSDRYIQDIVRPGLELKKLAKQNVRVTEDDIRTSFEAHYGEKIKCRWIVCKEANVANQVWTDLQASADGADAKIDVKEFERHATRSSADEGSRSLGGQIQPISRHTGPAFRVVEDAAFALRADGEISPVVRHGELWVILYRESRIAPVDVKLESVRLQLENEIYEAKQSEQMRQIFQERQTNAKIENYLTGAVSSGDDATASPTTAKTPAKAATADAAKKNAAAKAAAKPIPADATNEPIAARVNGEAITFNALAKEVIARRGPEVLETMISKRLIRQACQKKNVTVTAQEIDAEINRIAKENNMSRAEYAAFVKKQTEQPFEIFAQDMAWAALAMRKLAAPSVKLSEDDIRRGFEATFGDKMKCRWITFSDLKSATDTWNRLRESADADGKIKVAEFERQVSRWSTDVSTRALGGQLQPICRHTSPTFRALEDAAFGMTEDGQISKVVQVMDTYAILYREEHLPASDKKLDDVREELTGKLREAKLAEEMTRIFRDIQQSSTIENLLTGEISAPAKNQPVAKSGAPMTDPKAEPAKVATSKDATKKPQQPMRK